VSDDASADTREACGHPTEDGGECELPASRLDGRCHIHSTADGELFEGDTARSEREMLIDVLMELIQHEWQKHQDGRIRDEDKESLRIKRGRELAYIANVTRGLLEDRDLEELSERIEELEGQQQAAGIGVGVSTQ